LTTVAPVAAGEAQDLQWLGETGAQRLIGGPPLAAAVAMDHVGQMSRPAAE